MKPQVEFIDLQIVLPNKQINPLLSASARNRAMGKGFRIEELAEIFRRGEICKHGALRSQHFSVRCSKL